MSVTSVSNRWLNRLYKILAILLVLLAVLISAFRLLLPYVEHYRVDFQDYINERNQTNIVIGGLGMSWQRWGPTLVAKEVTIVEQEDAKIYIDHLEMEVDFWSTITRQRLVTSNLILAGAELKLAQGAWLTDETEADVTTNNDPEAQQGFEQVTAIFLNRVNKFSLRDSHISIYNQRLERDFYISNLQWDNRGSRHLAQGNIIVNELSSNNLTLKIDVNGDSFDELEGLMYIEANHLDITPWFDSILALENNKTKADVGFSTWLNVTKGRIERLQVVLHDNQISWQSKEGEQNLSLSAGQLLLVKGEETGSLKLFTTPLLMQFNQQAEQEYQIQMNKNVDTFSVYVSAFDLSLISQVSPLFITEQNTRELLTQLDITGKAENIYLKKSADSFRAVANFVDTSSHYSQGIPGVDNLSGQLTYVDNNLRIDVMATAGQLDFKELFVAPIVYDSFSAEVELQFLTQDTDQKGWHLTVDNLALTSPELNLSADLALNGSEKSETTMSLLASVTEGDASKAGHYFPLTTMSEGLIDYLNTAIVSGNITQAQVLINGPMSHFPFTDGSGIFVVDAELEQGVFNFDNDWANIENFYANLNFTNNSMLITGRGGSLAGLDVDGVQAAIDDLGQNPVLTVDTLIKPADANLVADLMAQSPLNDSVGAVLEHLQVSGNIRGEFHLNLPLNATHEVLASGIVHFSDNQLALQAPRMDFAQVNGQLSFENSKIITDNLSLTWLGMPLSLDIIGDNEADFYGTQIAITGRWQEQTWQQHLSPQLKKYIKGTVDWQGDISLYQHHNGGFSYDLTINSEVPNTTLYLPQPYNKAQGQQVPLSVSVTGQRQRSTFNASYGDQLSFFGVLRHENSHFERAHLVLGDEKMLLPMNGFHITTKLAQADFSLWQPLISDIIESVSDKNTEQANSATDSSVGLFSKPERIRGTLTKLDILGQQLNNVSFNLWDKTNWWLLHLNAKETRSRIKFYPDWLEQGIDVNADFIHFSAKGVTEETPEEDQISKALQLKEAQAVFYQVPKVNLHCDRCLVDKLDLGEVDLSLSRVSEHVIKIDHFSAQREQALFSLTGQWQHNEQGSTTQVSGDMMLKDIEYEMKQLGYATVIRDSGGKLNFDLSWQGGPHEFSFAYLDGTINTNIDDGYLAEVNDKARIFSILSLESLVRKLTLDFRDIFSDGMFYSSIKGDYQIKKGVVYTDNTRMNGTAGDLFIKGNTDLVSSTLDYHMTYKPNLTSSLPVLAWIATLNPMVFLAGVAIDQVITSRVVSEFNFELTGTVDEPNFKEVNRKNRDVSVGRSSPPEFVDNTNEEQEKLPENSNQQPLNQYKLIDQQNDLPREQNNG